MIILVTLVSAAAIFGSDDRSYIELSLSSGTGSKDQILAQSIAIAVLSPNRQLNLDGTYNLLVEQQPFCSDEKFAQDVSLSYACTGFLIAPDVLVTAGHCVYAANNENEEIRHESGKACEIFTWLFDFQINAKGEVQTQNIPEANFAKCKEIIYAVQNEAAPFLDFAIIKLDRSLNRPFLKLSKKEPVLNENVYSIGYPFGTPAKLSSNARVSLSNPDRQSFLTTLDVFYGNSGSPVFNSENEVIGILVAGTPSANTVQDHNNQCERFNRCDEDGLNCFESDEDTSIFPNYQGVGSEVQRLAPLKEWIGNR